MTDPDTPPVVDDRRDGPLADLQIVLMQVEVAGTYSPASQVAQAAQLVAVASAAGCTRPAAHVSHAATTTQEVARLSDSETETVLGLVPMYRR